MACFAPKPVYLKKGKRPIFIKDWTKEKLNREGKDTDFIACNKCIGCKIQKANDGAQRCTIESKQHTNNYFLTLTYMNEKLPRTEEGRTTLRKRDMQLFNKRLRRYYEYRGHTGIRYFGSGEYGKRTERPHYHYIYGNLPITDLKKTGKNKHGHQYGKSETINKIWGNSKIDVVIGKAEIGSNMYTAKYTLKKITNKKDEKDKREKEFINMSSKPRNS